MQISSKLIVVLVIVATFRADCSDNVPATFGMDSKDTCGDGVPRMLYLEDGQSVLVLGKILAEQQFVSNVCKIKFKPLSRVGKDYLMLKFDSFYINDCTITLDITQSPDSTFVSDVTELAHLVCNQKNPHIIYGGQDNTVQLTLSRDDIFFRNYNFRINVSLSEGPPRTGPTVAVIIGISAALIAVIAIIGFILIKYIRLKNSVLRERRAERAIESALYLYNSQEIDNRGRPPPHSSVPGGRTNVGANLSTGASQNRMVNGSRNQEETHSLLTIRLNSSRSNGHVPQTNNGDMIPPEYNESKDCLDIEGELPPSYEEALEMPKPPDSPLYANT